MTLTLEDRFVEGQRNRWGLRLRVKGKQERVGGRGVKGGWSVGAEQKAGPALVGGGG